ncbi:MAG: hypothetical protein D4S02_16755 [Rhodocyclaceae bacterium]|nr:MAG: hypothetical protein D4S02_16755 [Rhodocyclaceae bacterium]
MPHAHKQLRKILALLLCLAATGALAGDDWLISRVNGLWTWERSGPEGRVRKQFLNQEVLRLAEDGTVVAVSLQPIAAGKAVQCSERARRNPQDPCSSAFLECKPAGGGVFSALLGMVLDGSKGIVDARNAYRCAVNEDAVLEAASAVGLSDGSMPKTQDKPAARAANAPNAASPYEP